jgi:hypothetical protein
MLLTSWLVQRAAITRPLFEPVVLKYYCVARLLSNNGHPTACGMLWPLRFCLL